MTRTVVCAICAALFAALGSVPAAGQSGRANGVDLDGELARLRAAAALGSTTAAAAAAGDRVRLGRLLQLTGDREGAAEALAEAGTPEALAEAARLLVALGDYDGAARELAGAGAAGTLVEATRAAFASGDTRDLVRLAGDPAWAGSRPAVYYTLWRLLDDPAWRSRLLAEYPRSPEALLAGDGTNDGANDGAAGDAPVTLAASPQWLLFPGRDAVGVLAPAAAGATPATATAAPAATPPTTAAATPGAATVLQTGLYSMEANARAMAARLEQAGFEPQLLRRSVNGRDYWAVAVPAGDDVNAAILALKDAGFEAFPVFDQR